METPQSAVPVQGRTGLSRNVQTLVSRQQLVSYGNAKFYSKREKPRNKVNDEEAEEKRQTRSNMEERGEESNLLIHQYNVPKCCFHRDASIALTPAQAYTHVIEPNPDEKESPG